MTLIRITSDAQFDAIIARGGYICVLIYRDDDWGSNQMRAICMSYASEMRGVTFVSILDRDCARFARPICRAPISYVPTLCLSRDGRQYMQIIGTDISRLNLAMENIRHDIAGNPTLADHTVPSAKKTMAASYNRPILPRRK